MTALTILSSVPPYIFVATAGFLLVWSARRLRARGPMPPGPAGLPLLGNVLNVPKAKAWLTYMEWAERYSELTFIQPATC